MVLLYIFWFLHQTTTRLAPAFRLLRCISFDSYIKPQPYLCWNDNINVVYLLIPTSNHNAYAYSMIFEPVVYLLIPTSNHNWLWTLRALTTVVYLLIPTSNHNGWLPLYGINMLYIFWFLHQTTTLKGGKIKYYRLYIFWFLHQTTTRFYVP